MVAKAVDETTEREPLTDRQLMIYNYIRNRIVSGDTSPTVREIGNEFGIASPNGVREHLQTLVKKGWIEYTPYASRSITLVTKPCINSYLLSPGETIQIGDITVSLDSISESLVAKMTIQAPDCVDIEPGPNVLILDNE